LARLNRVLAARLGEALGTDCLAAVSRRPAPDLSPGELAAAGKLGGVRREDWLRGRDALKAVLAAEDVGLDTSKIAFPHRRYSITHAGGVAVAVATGAPGTGADLETRAPSLAAARRFLSEREFAGARGRAAWQRLWTVKEACFKADLANAGVVMTAYEADDPAARAGTARRRGSDARFRYVSLRTLGGWLSVAVRQD
jgi:hypothetical protein